MTATTYERANNAKGPFKKMMTNIIFMVAIVVIGIISIVTVFQFNNLIRANNWVEHTYLVVQTADKAVGTMTDIEAHQRGFLVTGDKSFLQDIDVLSTDVIKNADQLVLLTKDNPSQHEKAVHLNKLLKTRLEIIKSVMQSKTNNAILTPATMEIFKQGQAVSDEIKFLEQEFRDQEQTLLDERNSIVINNAHLTEIIYISGNILSIAFLLIALFLSNKELSIRVREEENRKILQNQLHSIIEGTNDMIAALDLDYRFFLFNEAYQKQFVTLFGKPIAIGMSLKKVLENNVEGQEKLVDSWKRSLGGEEFTQALEFTIENKTHSFELSSSPVRDQANKIIGAVHIVRNVTERAKEQKALQDSHNALNAGMAELKDRNEKITLLVEMSDVMLACSSTKELGNVVAKYCSKILDFSQGLLYIMHPSKNYLEAMACWGEPTLQQPIFSSEDCWALRLGHMNQVLPLHKDLLCEHIKIRGQDNLSHLCVPLMAQNDIYGLLYIEINRLHITDENDLLTENERLLVKAFAELAALSLANVRLRENLRFQSIRDPLTTLYNRRYLEEVLFKEIHQAERTRKPLGILMLDLDHFKKINDYYGHDAGDVALKELGKVLQDNVRDGDIAARFGGEEFIFVLYHADEKVASQRADDLRKAVSKIRIRYGSQEVGPITVSIGVSSYPQNGKNSAELIEAADKALYQAKNSGRDKVVKYSDLSKLVRQ